MHVINNKIWLCTDSVKNSKIALLEMKYPAETKQNHNV